MIANKALQPGKLSQMIRLEQILTPGRSLTNVPGGSKKRVLEQIAQLIARDLPDLDAQDIFESLISREKLGSTGFGNGIAIPHCRLPGCAAPISAVLHLEAAVDFDAIDGAPVDLLFVLLVPEQANETHLQLLSELAQMFSDRSFREELLNAPDAATLHAMFANWGSSDASDQRLPAV